MNSKKNEMEIFCASIMLVLIVIIALVSASFSAAMPTLIIVVLSLFLTLVSSMTGGLIKQGRLSDESCLKPNAIYEVMAYGRDHLDSAEKKTWLAIVKTQDGNLMALRLKERPPEIFKFVNPRNGGKCYIHEFPPSDNSARIEI